LSFRKEIVEFLTHSKHINAECKIVNVNELCCAQIVDLYIVAAAIAIASELVSNKRQQNVVMDGNVNIYRKLFTRRRRRHQS